MINYDTFFIKEFNNRKRKKVWDKDGASMKESLRFKLTLLKEIDKMSKNLIPEKYLEGEFYRLSLGYRGIGKNGGIVSGIRSEASKGKTSNETVNDHLVGATQVGNYIHKVFKENDYNINYMVDEWLYKHLFLWGTVKITREEHRKENVLRNSSHTIEQKLNREHYNKSVSKFI